MSLVLAGTLAAVLSAVVWSSQAKSRDVLEDRFETRVELNSRFAGNLISDVISREKLLGEFLFSTPQIDHQAFEQHMGALGLEAAVLLDQDGRFISGFPFNADLIGKDLTAPYEHLRIATREGKPAVSKVVPSAARGLSIAAFAAPFATPQGRRVLSGGYLLSNEVLSEFLGADIPIDGVETFLVDKDLNVVASSEGEQQVRSLGRAAPHLAAALQSAPRGHFTAGGADFFYSSNPVGGSSWTMVSSAPSDAILLPIRGPKAWIPWLLLTALAGAAFISARSTSRVWIARKELSAANAELAEANQQMAEFASVASHDLRSPLMTIKGFLTLLLRMEETSPSEDRKKMLEVVARNVDFMTRLTKEVLISSSFAAGGVEVQSERVNVRRAIEEAIPLEGTDIRIDVPDDIFVKADPSHVARIVRNYIANALKYGEPPVVVQASVHDGMVHIRVSDHGSGVSEDFLPHLFGKFKRAHVKDVRGSGLGLSIVKDLAEANGGEVRYSPVSGGGSCFEVLLPKA